MNTNIKKGALVLLVLLFLVTRKPQSVTLGDVNANTTWVYLSGLTRDFDSEGERCNRELLDRIGKKLSIKFIAVRSIFRCPQFDNKLCWPHETKNKLTSTYNYLQKVIKGIHLDGYVGFSNGAFFLGELFQHVVLEQHVILIGGAGSVKNKNFVQPKSLHVIIGKNDEYHYKPAQRFVGELCQNGISVNFVEHDGGHLIPEVVLEGVMEGVIRN